MTWHGHHNIYGIGILLAQEALRWQAMGDEIGVYGAALSRGMEHVP